MRAQYGDRPPFLSAVRAFFVLAKFVFSNQEFISGFVWTRIGSFLAALLLLLIPAARAHYFHTTKTAGAKAGGSFYRE